MFWLFPVAVVSVFVLFGLVIAGGGLIRLRRWWVMRRLDPAGMTADSGLQEFEGTARPVDGTVTAPFSETESLICEWEIDRYQTNDDGSNWETVESGTESVPFDLEHTGPTVAVDPEGAQFLLGENDRFDTLDSEEVPPGVERYLDHSTASIDVGPVELDLSGRLRFTERRLDPGDPSYVVGPVERAAAEPPGGSTARLSIDPAGGGWLANLLDDPFVVSDAGEQQAQRRQLKGAVMYLLVGLFFAGLPLGIGLVAI